MNVETYRRTIRRRIAVMSVLGAAYAVTMLATHMLWGGPADTGDFVWSAVVEGFVWGAVTAMVLFFALMVPRYRKALRDEQQLRRLWNREHDERMRAVKARAGAPMILYTSCAMVAVALLISPWNITVTMTLLFAGAAQLVVSVVVKLVCMRTM